MPPEYSDVYNQAIKYLGLRAHTVFELRTKLLRKKFPPEMIDQAIKQLMEQKYMSDEDFARVFVQNLVKYKTFGYYGIVSKLKQRGVSANLITQILDEELPIDEEKKIASRALGKSSKKEKVKLAQMLQRKGFRSQIIGSLIGNLSEE
jgi:regulatory protein